MNKKYVHILVICMLLALGIQAISSMAKKSPVCDEVSHHIATGYSFLKTGDFRLNSTSPPLTEELAAIPLLFLNPKLPLEHESWGKIDRVDFGYQFLYRYNDNSGQLVFWSRMPMVILSMLCGLLVFMFASDLYGKRAGLFALLLYCFSPNIIAYSRLDTPDIGATFFILLAIYRLYKFLKKAKVKNIIFTGLALGLALASKLSALILLPIFVVGCAYKSISSKQYKYLGYLCIIFILAAIVIFATYLGEFKPLLENDIDVAEKIGYINTAADKIYPGNNQQIKDKIVDFALNVPIPFATYIMNILAETNMVFVKDYGTFLMGARSASGWWYYYIMVFLFKTPIPTIILLILALALYKKAKPSNRLGEHIILFFLVIFIFASLLTKLQLSVRYLLPIYPFLFIIISRVINVKIRKQFFLNIFLFLLFLWYVIISIAIYPDYISYFNEFAQGPNNGWRYLRDANIDYGQDLPALAAYLNNNKIEEISLSYFGTSDPKYYGIKYKHITENELQAPKRRVYAISANNIDTISWKDSIAPTAKAGYSIFIYDFRDK